jgi:hypothetical protein
LRVCLWVLRWVVREGKVPPFSLQISTNHQRSCDLLHE